MTIFLCNIKADALKLDKRPDYDEAEKREMTCQLNTPVNVDRPELILSVDVATGYNYAFIPAWQKYYFLHDATVLDGTRCMIPATCDVLTTNAEEIKDLNVRVKRYEANRNPDVQDNGVTKTARTHTDNYIFSGGYAFFMNDIGALTDIYHYALSVVGGDGSQSGGEGT